MTYTALLPDRAVLRVSGEDRVTFLQGLVSNDVMAVAPERAVWAAMLTPQGKWLADFFIFADADRLLLDVEAGQRDMLAALLSRYRLRAKATLEKVDASVFAAWGGEPPPGPVRAPDPRVDGAGWRLIGGDVAADATAADYDLHRLRLGLPDGSRDLEPERSTLVESGFDELNGIGWEKGCYMGQELTARTKYRGLVKRRLVAVRVEGALPEPGTPVTLDGAEVGTIRSGRGDRALASLKLEAIRAERFDCGDAVLRPETAAWMRAEPVRLASA